MEDRLLKLPEIARMLQYSTHNIRKMLFMRRIPQPIRMGKDLRWRSSEMQRFLEVDCNMRRFIKGLPEDARDAYLEFDDAGSAEVQDGGVCEPAQDARTLDGVHCDPGALDDGGQAPEVGV